MTLPQSLPRPGFFLPRRHVQNSTCRELPRSRYSYDFSRRVSVATRGDSTKIFCMRGVCYGHLLVGKTFCHCFWLYWQEGLKHILYTFRFRATQMAHTCDILGWVNHFFMILCSIQSCFRVKGLLPRNFRKE